MLPPASQDARLISDLYQLIFYLAVFTFVLVEGLIIYSALRFRRRQANEAPAQIHGNAALEITWTVIPAIVVGLIFGFAADTMSRLQASGTLTNPINHVHAINDQAALKRVEEAAPAELVIHVTGFQWFWQYKYPDGNVTSNDVLILPENKHIRLDLTSADVIHAWWMPRFGPMIYVNPGELSHVWFSVPAGDYLGQCNAFCGAKHYQMLSKVKVLPQAEFDTWYNKEQEANAGPLVPGDPAKGREFFLNGPCITCHFIEGTKAQGRVAPRELTHFATYPTIAQVPGFTNNAENVEKWLHDPQAIKPGTAMPNLNLKPQDIKNLAAFLETLK